MSIVTCIYDHHPAINKAIFFIEADALCQKYSLDASKALRIIRFLINIYGAFKDMFVTLCIYRSVINHRTLNNFKLLSVT